ncbi:hypothetical protein AJ80_07565 [Polytolypa hystricis UAMH7299]|uniref:Uncharacterized protein n=1 Tax=Polytolypa hystricis (strain UAMH7299) TaxID=1447883 RepID=A0A2B7XMF4_POLH7|nr:hypothetical protein AJ80_07565 [Polytolypa hystricis UAMH7299]
MSAMINAGEVKDFDGAQLTAARPSDFRSFPHNWRVGSVELQATSSPGDPCYLSFIEQSEDTLAASGQRLRSLNRHSSMVTN